MNTTETQITSRRGLFHGVGQVMRFNWPRYAAAVFTLAACLVLELSRAAAWMRICGWAAILFTAFWTAASVIGSYWVYDRSGLMDWDWVKIELPGTIHRWLNIHAGLDESTNRLAQLWPNSAGKTVDIFAPEEMTERSIHRARRESKDSSQPANYSSLPFGAQQFDAVFLFFAVHELRHPEARRSFFAEVKRVLAVNGRAILVEHLRDPANFAVYSYGFLHFHSRRTWRHDIAAAGLQAEREFSFTPFVRVFILKGNP